MGTTVSPTFNLKGLKNIVYDDYTNIDLVYMNFINKDYFSRIDQGVTLDDLNYMTKYDLNLNYYRKPLLIGRNVLADLKSFKQESFALDKIPFPVNKKNSIYVIPFTEFLYSMDKPVLVDKVFTMSGLQPKDNCWNKYLKLLLPEFSDIGDEVNYNDKAQYSYFSGVIDNYLDSLRDPIVKLYYNLFMVYDMNPFNYMYAPVLPLVIAYINKEREKIAKVLIKESDSLNQVMEMLNMNLLGTGNESMEIDNNSISSIIQKIVEPKPQSEFLEFLMFIKNTIVRSLNRIREVTINSNTHFNINLKIENFYMDMSEDFKKWTLEEVKGDYFSKSHIQKRFKKYLEPAEVGTLNLITSNYEDPFYSFFQKKKNLRSIKNPTEYACFNLGKRGICLDFFGETRPATGEQAFLVCDNTYQISFRNISLDIGIKRISLIPPNQILGGALEEARNIAKGLVNSYGTFSPVVKFVDIGNRTFGYFDLGEPEPNQLPFEEQLEQINANNQIEIDNQANINQINISNDIKELPSENEIYGHKTDFSPEKNEILIEDSVKDGPVYYNDFLKGKYFVYLLLPDPSAAEARFLILDHPNIQDDDYITHYDAHNKRFTSLALVASSYTRKKDFKYISVMPEVEPPLRQGNNSNDELILRACFRMQSHFVPEKFNAPLAPKLAPSITMYKPSIMGMIQSCLIYQFKGIEIPHLTIISSSGVDENPKHDIPYPVLIA